MEKLVSEKYGVQNEEQAKALVDTLLNNAAEQIVASEFILAEYNIDHTYTMDRFKYILFKKSTKIFMENMFEHLKNIEENANEGESE